MFKINNDNFVELIFGEVPVNRVMLGVSLIYLNRARYKEKYLTFDVITGGTIIWKKVGTATSKTIYYSLNNGETWNELTSTNTLIVSSGDKILFKGENTTYATDKNNYSGFEGGTATYNIEGNIMSLIYGDNFKNNDTLPGQYTFCSIFKLSNAVSAENLILPSETLTNYCYRAMFSKAPLLEKAPALPATTLATGVYWYMFENCPITKAPDLLTYTPLPAESYGHMFEGCTNLNYVKCLAIDHNANNVTLDWLKNSAATGKFIKHPNATWSTGNYGIPSGWEVVDAKVPEEPIIVFDSYDTILLLCETQEANIYYRLGLSESWIRYTSPIIISLDTTIQAYSRFDKIISNVVSLNCVYNTYTLSGYTNRDLNNWKYNNSNITVPYSINAIDGHSSYYARGEFNFETEFVLRKTQPTYLWFLHADQSALVFIDNTLVTKHWGGYNAFFVDISNNIHSGLNKLKVILKNNEGNSLAPNSGDFNFNATLGYVKLFTSPCLPSTNYGYDGFHVTSTVSSSLATINVKTTIPSEASATCTISGVNCNYSETKTSLGSELTFTTTINNPRLWNGKIDPYLYTITLNIYYGEDLYHTYQRGYGLRYYEYVINDTLKVGTNENPYTGFLLNGNPYLLRGVCMHSDLNEKANALTRQDIANDFSIILELGCNFIRLAHYPHPKEVYDWCDLLGIIVETEAPCVNNIQATMPDAYYEHLTGQYIDMVNQHYNHPCIIFWGLGNEAKIGDLRDENNNLIISGKEFAKQKCNEYTALIKSLDPYRWVGYVCHQGAGNDPSYYFGDPDCDWFGGNIYVGWYDQPQSNTPTSQINNRLTSVTTNKHKPFAVSEYGCGGTQDCHTDDISTTNKGSGGARHDIEHMMWLHEGHITTIKLYPQLLFSAQWLLFDFAVYNRNEGYTLCYDGTTTQTDDSLRRLNDKGLVMRDHITKKDTFYLYKAWWNPDPFVHICQKSYTKMTDRVIKCYTNENSLSMYVNNVLIETVSVTNNIAEFTERNFLENDEIVVLGATSNDTLVLSLS